MDSGAVDLQVDLSNYRIMNSSVVNFRANLSNFVIMDLCAVDLWVVPWHVVVWIWMWILFCVHSFVNFV